MDEKYVDITITVKWADGKKAATITGKDVVISGTLYPREFRMLNRLIYDVQQIIKEFKND